ncbi:type VI secretion protein IcmF/TssM N-terminal domain-containing protein [Mangrovibacter phragmitis]|uniref:type VI secretion protein IcmF/TssM N-terminal domain-containing protein n=1 Tax=Mangrovibacter phragmitis TaxID=1691903 RepID=UPI0035129009
MLKKLACFTGWLLVICLSLLFCFTLGLWQNWSTPVIVLCWLLMLLITAVIWAGAQSLVSVFKGKKGQRFLRRYRLSRREGVLLSHWNPGASVIRRIRRKRTRLPWYILLGEQSGKSTLLASAGLPRFYDDGDNTVIGPTRTLRWWFFRNLCVLDLSSNFLKGSAPFHYAWGKIAHWCARMPAPAGMIVTIPMSALIEGDFNALHASARRQRALIEPLMRRFSSRLPLYVLVTQCDAFPGFSLWHNQLSPEQRQQTLGYNWRTPLPVDGQDEQTLQALFTALHHGMSQVRMSMGRPEHLSAQDYATLLDFPEAFGRLEPALRYALAALCEPNAYFSHTTLSGVWFGAAEIQADNTGRRESVFMHDLLTQHLHALSLHHHSSRWFFRSWSHIACRIVLGICACWIIVSAVFSTGRIRSDLEQLSPQALAAFLADEEKHSAFSLRYLPFSPLLNWQHTRAETRLLSQSDSMPRLAGTTLSAWQQRVLSAEPAEQRELILQLANALQIWQHMQDGAGLAVLEQLAPVDEALQPRTWLGERSLLERLAFERHYMQSPAGVQWYLTAQQLLISLVNHDPELEWLVAPGDALIPLQASAFWPSLPGDIALPGARTRSGKATLNEWVALLEHSAGQPLPLLQQAQARWQVERQDAWRQYLADISAHLVSPLPVMMPREALIAIGQNKSYAMNFATNAVEELSDIPTSLAQPWLVTLRQLQRLSHENDMATLLRRAAQTDNRMRQSLGSWLKGFPDVKPTWNLQQSEQAWRKWLDIRNKSVQDAVAQSQSGGRLTRGLFAGNEENDASNPIVELLPAMQVLQGHFSAGSDDTAVAAIWAIFEDDARRLLGNAMAHSACWLNSQWKTTVIRPLGNQAEVRSYADQQSLSHQIVSDFLSGPAKALLTLGPQGVDAAEYADMRVPLEDDFLYLVRHAFPAELFLDVPERATTREGDLRASLQAQVDDLVAQQRALEKDALKLQVTSHPATIPGGAAVMPTGTRLTLNCQKNSQQLTNMNFTERADFSWQPGQCNSVSLDINFPDFSVKYALTGDDAWPWFVQRFASGEAYFENHEFGEDESLLNQLGIKQILVRLSVSDPYALNEGWQRWLELASYLSDAREQLANLDAHSARQQSRATLASPISALPGDIAQCL